ncbi:glycosyltransferase family 4 protein [Verrucomicrobiota bacterium sgz303538]
MPTPTAPSFAYLFERFPSFVQTFCYREVAEMVRQGMEPLIVSIREPEEARPAEFPADIPVQYLPAGEELTAKAKQARADRSMPRAMNHTLQQWTHKEDRHRVYEALHLGPMLRKAGVRHVHAHFAGMAARTAYWLHRFYGITYSVTGHANDIFCASDFPVSLQDLLSEARFVVTETDFARRWLEERFPAAHGKTFRVFNGIALDGFLSRNVTPSKPYILSVGRYVEKKGFNDLITACGLLRQRLPDFECLIVGGGPLESELQAQIEREHLDGTVKLLGPKPQEEVRRLLAGASAFALACVPESDGGSDNLPTVVMEAMAARVPVVSTKLAGVPEMITDGEDGLLVASKDPTALAVALERLLRDPAFGERLAEKGRATAEAKFAIATTTGELKHLLVRKAGIIPPASARALDPELPSNWLRKLARPFLG